VADGGAVIQESIIAIVFGFTVQNFSNLFHLPSPMVEGPKLWALTLKEAGMRAESCEAGQTQLVVKKYHARRAMGIYKKMPANCHVVKGN